MVRKLKKLEHIIDVSVLEPCLSDQGWRFGDYPGARPDPLFGSTYMHEIYTRADPGFSGRATVPVLWDKVRGTIVNNESADIISMFNSAFDEFGDTSVDLYPQGLRSEVDAVNAQLYDSLNNGVYKAGFASSQDAYNEAVSGVFETLDIMETRLSDGRTYLLGDRLTMSDIRLFVTLIRFDTAYHGIFKCNLRRICDYAVLPAYMDRILAIPGIIDTVNLNHIKAGYYSIKALNPTGIIPAGPAMASCASI